MHTSHAHPPIASMSPSPCTRECEGVAETRAAPHHAFLKFPKTHEEQGREK
ncbi:hypothetical protein E2C01_086972 [Portunus trituberculatus]|uniref:Uncharacterized protein n=1 Tax=Portunus trituberculatus TaxID=210409 RepID=A0A5B7JAR6_PORTR|nr:hypothetical protein [Portunus trituberculatus]